MSSFKASSSFSTAQIDKTETVIGLINAMSSNERVKCFKVLEAYWSAYVYEEKVRLEVEEYETESEYDVDDEDCESEVGKHTIECYYDESIPLLTDISLDEIDQVLIKHDEEEFFETVKDVVNLEFKLVPLLLSIPTPVAAIIKEEPVEIVTPITPVPAQIAIPKVVTPVVTTTTKPTVPKAKVIAKRTSVVPPKSTTTTTTIATAASKRASLAAKPPVITPSNAAKPSTTRANRMSLASAPSTNTVKPLTTRANRMSLAPAPTTTKKVARAPLQSIAVPNTKSLPPVEKKPKTNLKNRVSLAPGTRAERFAGVNTHAGPVF